jgi:hypothetical protein
MSLMDVDTSLSYGIFECLVLVGFFVRLHELVIVFLRDDAFFQHQVQHGLVFIGNSWHRQRCADSSDRDSDRFALIVVVVFFM